MTTPSTVPADSTRTKTPHGDRSRLRRALQLAARTAGLRPDQVELAHELHADLDAAGAPSELFAHNLAVLVAELLDAPETVAVGRELAQGGAALLANGLTADGDDLTIALALARAVDTTHEADESLLRTLLAATERPHAGDRLLTAVALAFAAAGRDVVGRNAASASLARTSAPVLVEKLDALLARRPDREGAVLARLKLLALEVDSPVHAQRDGATRRFQALAAEADAAFGTDPDRDVMRLSLAIARLRDRQQNPSAAFVADALELAERLGGGIRPPVDDLLRFEAALAKRRALSGDTGRRVLTLLRRVCGDVPEDPTARAAIAEVLEALGDADALLDFHTRLMRAGAGDDASRDALARKWLRAIESGAPSPLSAEVEGAVIDKFPSHVARDLDGATALVFLERVAETQGPARAGLLAERVLLSQRALSRDPDLVVRAVQLLADGGDPERALSVGHTALNSADSSALRLTLAKIHFGAGIRVAEAETVLRPLASVGGAVSTEARALREQIIAHPSFGNDRRDALVAVEQRVGIGKGKNVRCRVIFPSDRYALAEMPGARAPTFYQHRFLRVMVTPGSCPDGLSIADLTKGYEFVAEVVAEDDDRGDRIRVYWIADGKTIQPIGVPKHVEPEEEERPAPPTDDASEAPSDGQKPHEPVVAPPPEIEAAFHIGTELPARLRVERVMRQKGLVLTRAVPPDGSDGEPFPVRVAVHRRFLPADLKANRIRAGAIFLAPVEREPGDVVRYRAASMVTVEWLPEELPAHDEGAPKEPPSEPAAAPASDEATDASA